jgi:hypothetical protein
MLIIKTDTIRVYTQRDRDIVTMTTVKVEFDSPGFAECHSHLRIYFFLPDAQMPHSRSQRGHHKALLQLYTENEPRIICNKI